MTIMRSLSDPIIAKATCLGMSKTWIMNSLASFSLLMLTFVILSSISLFLMTSVPYAHASTVGFAGNTEGITNNAVDDSKMIIVTLNGSSSTDPDGAITSYRWEQTAGSPAVTLSDPNAVNPTFRVPASMLMGSIDADTTLTFRLTVTDNNGASDSSDVNVVLKRSPLKDERETSSLSLPDNSSTNVTSALDNATATNQVGLASQLSAVSPVLPQNTTLSLSPSSFDSDSGSNTYSKQLQLLGQGVQNKSSSSAPTSVLDNDGDMNLTKSSDKLLKSKWNMTAVQGTEQPSQLFQQKHPLSPQQLFEDGRGQRGQEAGLPQQLQQKQESQGLPFSSNSPTEGLEALGGGIIGLDSIENGTLAPTSELSQSYPLQVFPPPVLPTAPTSEPLLAHSQHLLPPTSLAEPLYSSATNPPDTFITSAMDNSTELNIQNGPITTSTSNSITLTFSGTDDLGINGYVCSVDGLNAFTCSSPIVLDINIFQTIQSGSLTNTIHRFQVSAIDSSGTMDPTPAVFSWIMTDPSSTDTAPSESSALAPLPGASSLAIPILPPQQQQQLQQQQIQSQTAVQEHLAPDTILPPNSFEYQLVLPQITIPPPQAPFVPLQ